jgi:hypothetical protein
MCEQQEFLNHSTDRKLSTGRGDPSNWKIENQNAINLYKHHIITVGREQGAIFLENKEG